MLPQHETSHTTIIDNQKNLPVAVLSSCKKVSKGFEFLSQNNYKGDILQNGQPKEQWMRPYDHPRYYEDSQVVTKNIPATEFVNASQNAEKIDSMLNKSNTHKKVPIKRVHKDSSELYHENGQPIFDSQGYEIDY